MRLALAAVAVSAASFASATLEAREDAQCPGYTQFGDPSVSPYNVTAGDNLTISTDFNCAITYYGNIPQYTDYYIKVSAITNGLEPPILLARRTLPAGSTSDQFTVQIPYAFYFPDAVYVVSLDTTYPVNGTNGSPYSVVGGIEVPINITAT